MLRIGLTGGIGSGKSTVASLFKRLGVPVFDLDQIAREVVEPGQPALLEIVDHFGEQVLNNRGQLDRSRLREIVFKNSQEKLWLENLLHPLIRQRQMELESQTNSPYILIEIPLLVENIETQQVDRILVVEISKQAQVERTMQRSSLSEVEVLEIISSQASSESRRAVAHDLIDNNGSVEDLSIQVKELHERYLAIAENS